MRIAGSEKAFTLVEIMIVVGIIAILASMAVPNFMRSRQAALQNTCIENMMRIRNAIDMWALDANAAVGITPLSTDIVPDYLRTWPTCGGTGYDVPAVGSDPICPKSTAGHVLTSSGSGGGGETPPVPPHPSAIGP
ncbi:MAG: type II secretion system protein [Candidatus Omnitrophica bacterium]|nr:type II secretion system protein [Candidatus Omnitrophota bacterium]